MSQKAEEEAEKEKKIPQKLRNKRMNRKNLKTYQETFSLFACMCALHG